MRTPIYGRTLTDDDTRALEQGVHSSDASMLRRCQIVLASAAGHTGPPDQRQPRLQ